MYLYTFFGQNKLFGQAEQGGIVSIEEARRRILSALENIKNYVQVTVIFYDDLCIYKKVNYIFNNVTNSF
jgi:hypothetical protein